VLFTGVLARAQQFFSPHTDPAAWGVDLPNSPIIAFLDTGEQLTTFLVPVRQWSDGTSDQWGGICGFLPEFTDWLSVKSDKLCFTMPWWLRGSTRQRVLWSCSTIPVIRKRHRLNTNLHLGFTGNCDAAFTYYESIFGSKRLMTMKYGDAPAGTPVPDGAKGLVMHTAMRVGSITLMGADAPPGHGQSFGGFQVSLEDANEAEVKRLFAALSDEGSVMMPLAPTFWSPLFGMCTDKFGVSWMVSVPAQPA
jgi:PhnB protein